MALWLSTQMGCWGIGYGMLDRLKTWVTPELRSINREIPEIQQQLVDLPTPTGTSSGIQRGFQTGTVSDDQKLWVEVILPRPEVIDCVVLVPLLAKGSRGEVAGFGFPKRFQLEAIDEHDNVHLLMDQTGDDFPNPGLYPVLVNCSAEEKIVRIRLTATEAWGEGGPRKLALAEMFVLRGNLNLAAGGKVKAVSSLEMRPTWSRTNLIDMITQLGLPITPQKDAPPGWHSEVTEDINAEKTVTLDFGRVVPIDEIRLVPSWRPGMPIWHHYGFPSRFRLELAGLEDFSDRWVSPALASKSVGQNVRSIRGNNLKARFLRISTIELRKYGGVCAFALGELQAYSGDQNIALKAKVIAEESKEDDGWSRSALNDGLAAGGRLLELPEWIRDLEKRRLLENRLEEITNRQELLLVSAEQTLVYGGIGSIGGAMGLAVGLSWYGRRRRRITREQNRERLARDLHDELGSNLGSIALISSFGVHADSDEQQMRRDLAEIERVARESADSMRDMVQILGARQGDTSEDWLGVLRGLAGRMIREAEIDYQLPKERPALEPDMGARREIYLFCKEVLFNIARHAHAKNVLFRMSSSPAGLEIEITDDGIGFDPESGSDGHGLRNLRERAAGLRATMKLTSSPGCGTSIILKVPRGRRWQKPSSS